MNSTLLVANAIALAIVLGVQFAPKDDEVAANQRTPHYLQLQRTPQLAVMNNQTRASGQDASQGMAVATTQSSDRLVF
ncbi:hypothetical protein [Pseudomonas violetae]|jgi:hypothetical protein|uniref:Uncharacterized protein n=1 Tax=Pseudomonas violetae TaxID=2915813 RepID=A0ABT0F0V1_9PSED|nr:hypothetical protein [Pseudomonas violetae]MCK1791623.1 hypothetical protein [Pseudomonas violetae]